jgi:hypothetical protein
VSRNVGRQGGTEQGLSLLEVTLTASMVLVVLAVVYQGLVGAQSAVIRQTDRGRTNDEIRLAIGEVEKQARSATRFYPPTDGGRSLVLSTRVNPTASASERCVQFRITGGRLQMRRWSPDGATPAFSEGWRGVAEGIRNTSTTPAFVLAGERLLRVELIANLGGSGPDARMGLAVTGRNVGRTTPPTCTVPSP